MAGWYREGFVSLTNGSAVVTGVGNTLWATTLRPGMVFTTDFTTLYEIKSVDSDTQITLDRAWAGATAGTPQVSTVTITVVSATAAQTATVTIAGVDYSFTSDATPTATEIATGLAIKVNASTTCPMSAAVASGKLVLTGKARGQAITVVVGANLVLATTAAVAAMPYAVIYGGAAISNAEVVAEIMTMIKKWQVREDQYDDWVGGQPDGGPNGDGKYPLTDSKGVTRLVESPGVLMQLIDDGLLDNVQQVIDAIEDDVVTAQQAADTATTAASTATSKASAAATSATNAATSATNAATSATNATTSATNAKTSETNAGNSAKAAATSMASAEGYKTAAETAKTAAESARDTAAGAAAAAAAARDTATGAAATATTARDTATGAATTAANAAAAATDAKTTAQNAATDSVNAKVLAVNAQTVAEQRRDEAIAARDEAKAWASNPTGIPVTSGGFSAYHWAAQAQTYAQQAQVVANGYTFAVIGDGTAGKINATASGDVLHLVAGAGMNLAFDMATKKVTFTSQARAVASEDAAVVVRLDNTANLAYLSLDESKISHTALTGIGTNSHAQIDTHIASTASHVPPVAAGQAGYVLKATGAGAQAWTNDLTGVALNVSTAAVNTNTTQIASTAFVLNQAATATPTANGPAAVGTATRFAREDHVHPTDSTRAPLASPTFTGTVTLPGDPTSDLHAAPKRYVDGLPAKNSVRAATTADLGVLTAATQTLTGPPATYTTTGTTTSGSTSVTAVASASSKIKVGASVSGTGVPASTTVTAVSGTTVTLSAAATASGTGVSLTFTQTIAALAVDGVTLALNDRVLVKDQTSTAQNGIYSLSTLGTASVAWVLTRAADADSWADLVSAIVSVDEGSANTNATYFCTAIGGGTLGTTAVTFQLLSNNQISNLAGLSATGLVARTAANTFAARTLTAAAAVTSGGTGYLSVTNGNGGSGNPTIALVADTANTASTLVARDASGNFSAGTITATLSGNASTASSAAKLTTARKINTVSFDGTADITVKAATTNALTIGTGLTGASFDGSSAVTIAVDGTAAATASKVVIRDSAGNASFADPTADAHAATRGWVESLPAKNSVRVATTADLGYASATATTLTGKAATVTTNGTLTSGSTSVTGVTNAAAAILVGASVSGTGVPAGATVSAVSGTTVTLSAAATATGTNALTFTQTIAALAVDGVTLALNDRVLVKNSSSAARNGIYYLSTLGDASTAWVLTRSSDGNTWADLISALVGVDEGTANTNSQWFCTSSGAGTLGTTSVGWQLVSNAQTAALGNLSSAGLVARTAANTVAARTITPAAAVTSGGTGYLKVTNGDGVSGNPTLALQAATTNTASTLVARDANGDFAAGKATLTDATIGGNAALHTGNAHIGFRNKFHNPRLRVSQRGVGPSLTTGKQVSDRWGVNWNGVNQIQQRVFNNTNDLGSNWLEAQVVTATSTLPASAFLIISQSVEIGDTTDLNWGTSRAKDITIAFKYQSSQAATYAAYVRNDVWWNGGNNANANNRSYIQTFPVVAGEGTITLNFPGPTTGNGTAWNRSGFTVGFDFGVCLAAGSDPGLTGTAANTWLNTGTVTVAGCTNMAATQGAYFRITDTTCEIGGVATPIAAMDRPFAVETLLCQRYLQILGAGICGAATANGQAFDTFISPIVPMRTTPTISFAGTTPVFNNVSSEGVYGVNNGVAGQIRYEINVSTAGAFYAFDRAFILSAEI